MLVLVLGANFRVLFVFWEGVGLCSYLLIGFWFEKQAAADAAKKAFVVNRIGDFGFLLGIFLMFGDVRLAGLRATFATAAASGRSGSTQRRRADGDLPAAVRRRGRARAPSSRCTSGCRTRWKARRRSAR